MCGIAGIWKRKDGSVSGGDILRMSALIEHRGPDDKGHALLDTSGKLPPTHYDESKGRPAGYDLALAARRLAILDLSEKGHMPMSFQGCTMVYNGEIYNYVEIRDELLKLGHRFESHGDTEVLLHSYIQWGVECLDRLNGMFAFAIWDSRSACLFCGRDRLGIKPFYYRATENEFLFGSEIRCILAETDRKPDINEKLVYDYLAVNRLEHTDETFFEGIVKLPAGAFLLATRTSLEIKRYWKLTDRQTETPLKESAERFKELFEDSVRIQMRSDVTVGSCLSGGMDSSTLVCVAAPGAETGMKTFTARYKDGSMDEMNYALSVAKKAGVQAVEMFSESRCFWDELPDLLTTQEEPFGGPTIYAQWNLMQKVRAEGVTVILDGQGGDELMCGYAKYFFFSLMEMKRRHQYGSLLKSLLLAPFNGGAHLTNLRGAQKYMPRRFRQAAGELMTPDFQKKFADRDLSLPPADVRGQQIIDIEKNSIPVLLRYEDKNSMAHSIESRVPFLDHRLVEFAVSLPTDQKINGGQSKRVMREAFGSILPKDVLERRTKLGFGGHFDSWLSELRPQLQSWVDSKTLPIFRYVSSDALRQKLSASDTTLFRLLILDKWLDRYGYG